MTDGEQIDYQWLLLSTSKEVMAEEIIRLRREVKKLKEQIEQAAAKEAERKSRQQECRRGLKTRWKKLGAPIGHYGATRPKPEHIDKVIEQRLDSCPDCGCK